MPLFRRNVCNRGSPKPRRLTRLAVFLSAFSLAASANAATYYVATNGSDSNPGTSVAPFKTIQAAVGVVKAGDTIMIHAGNYPAFDLRNKNGSPGAPITIKGEPGAIVDRNLGGGNGFRNIELYGGSYITIDGLELIDSDNGPGPTSCVGTDNGAGRNAIKFNDNPHHIILTNLNIHDIRGHGILAQSDYLQIVNNQIHDNGGKNKGWSFIPEAYGTYVKGNHLIISGNSIHDNAGNGIRTGNPPDEYLNDSIIENNLSYNNGGTFSHPNGVYGSPDFHCENVTGGDGIVMWYGDRNITRNNVVFGNAGYGIRVHGANNAIYNNTVYQSGLYGIYSYEDGNYLKNNISYLSKYANVFGGTQSNNVTIDPQFVNPAGGDFGLQATSPAIDKGVTLAEVPKDFTGKNRPEGAAYDIGAFEGAGSKANVVPTGTVVAFPPGGTGAGGSGAGAGRTSGGLSNCAR